MILVEEYFRRGVQNGRLLVRIGRVLGPEVLLLAAVQVGYILLGGIETLSWISGGLLALEFLIGLALTWFDIVTSEPFDRLTYALSYAQGHVDQSLWTPTQAAEFAQRAWLNHLPELLWRMIVYGGITIGLVYAQCCWRRRYPRNTIND